MMRSIPLLLLATIASAALAAPGGPIDTLQLGTYACELPGDAAGPAGLRQPGDDFAIVNASSYAAGGKRGTYLLTGSVVQMTSGPLKGARYAKLSDNFLRKLTADGSHSDLRCVRAVTNNR